MKFRIKRTSQSCFCESKPCDGAYIDKFEPDSRDSHYDQRWWAIEIESLDDLLALAEKEGEIIVKAPSKYTDDLPEIEIYDDYRE
jgi:hypothetical protein